MKLYYVIEENVSKDPTHKGKKYIRHGGYVYEYGDFREENGYKDFHKAELEHIKCVKRGKKALSLSSVNKCEFYIILIKPTKTSKNT